MRQGTFLLGTCLMLAGVIAFPAMAGITLRAGRPPKAQPIEIVSYLSDTNEALRRALQIHNLMNEMPMLRNTAQTASDLKTQSDLFKEMQKNITSCNVKKLGKVFKKPDQVWGKMLSSYEKQRQGAQQEIENQQQDPLTVSLSQRRQNDMVGWTVNREIVMDVYENPEKWGEVNQGAAFPLWKDQIALFEKQWNQFYENLNVAYGVPLKGRPAIDEETRHNANKYDVVLAAHKAYVAQVSEGRRPTNPEVAKANPPKAPKALPRWQDIVRVDPITGKAIPELPEPWRQMSDNQFQNYAGGGEMAQFFDGKSMTPSSITSVTEKSDLESEYDMTLAIDAMDKGVAGTAETQQKLVHPFVEKLSELGIDTKDFDIANRAQYVRVQKELKEMKKAAIAEAYQYVERLEAQDKNSPDLVAKRQQLQAQKRARLSPEAQAALGDNAVIQMSQMSPVAQQRLVLSALEKDAGASVHLTQTNAVNVDQLMREQRSTDKVIAESYQQVNTVMEKQRADLPQMAKCQF
ncbi:MAG: hypothetical protein ACI4OR_00125 [Alphaproteobacteria bacterium]